MAWIVPTTGHCDRIGRVRCVACHEAAGVASDLEVVADNSAFHGVSCDACGLPFPVIRGVDWDTVHVS